MSQEVFIKSQLVAFCKVLKKSESPLKQKHVRELIMGTHKLRSARVFWHAASRVQLEKNPVLTWKFCQLLHKLIHDGHRKVSEDSIEYCSRITQLGNFWKHLRTSGYAMANTSEFWVLICLPFCAYCKLLTNRLNFHKKYPSIPGNLTLSTSQIEAVLMFDLNECFELAIDVLDQFDDLLALKASISTIMESMRWSSLVPQGQCLLAPLILVILDSSKFYDFLVKALFKLHSSLPPDTLSGHRERFNGVFVKTKKLYEDAAALQYFKYLVSIPTLPSGAPNFLQVSDLDSYQPPQAYLHATASSEGGETPPDSQSVIDEPIIDFSSVDNLSLFNSNINFEQSCSHRIESDPREEIISNLRQELQVERETKEQLIREAHSRIEQYENRLIQMKNEIDLYKRSADDRLAQLQSLQASSVSNHQELAEKQAKNTEETEKKFHKMKTLYQQLREDHIKSLTEIKEMKAKAGESECIAEKARNDASIMEKKLEVLNLESTKFYEDRAAEAKKIKEQRDTIIDSICSSAILLLERSLEDLNSTQISYPTHIVHNSLKSTIEHLESVNQFLSDFRENPTILPPTHSLILLANSLSSALQASSIFSATSEECLIHLGESAINFYTSLRHACANEDLQKISTENLKLCIVKLCDNIKSLPLPSNDLEKVGDQLDEEVKNMNAVIQQAVEQIEELHKKSKEINTGIKLEVNDKILLACTDLMGSVRQLVIYSNELQTEIVKDGKGSASPNDFYKRNHVWTDGLISAARAVGVSANYLVASADGLIMGKGKLEQIIVAAQEIGASVAQLFISSRVKARKDSITLPNLGSASKAVNKNTAALVACVKSAQQSLLDQKMFSNLDFSNLSLHEAKKEEMESQIKTLELESELNRERIRLAELRKLHYHLASLVSGENGDDTGKGNDN